MDRDQNHKMAFLLQAVNFAAALITEPTFLGTFIYLKPRPFRNNGTPTNTLQVLTQY